MVNNCIPSFYKFTKGIYSRVVFRNLLVLAKARQEYPFCYDPNISEVFFKRICIKKSIGVII